MTDAQLLILANVSLVVMVGLEWAYRGWCAFKQKRRDPDVVEAQSSHDVASESATDVHAPGMQPLPEDQPGSVGATAAI